MEVGIRRWQQGTCEFFCDRDMLCYFQLGRGVFRRATGESIDAARETTTHFKPGWHGALEVFEPLDATFMTCDGGPSLITPVLRDVLTAAPFKHWGAIPTMIEGTSHTAGILLSRESSGRAESVFGLARPEFGDAKSPPLAGRGTCDTRRTMRKIYMIR